MFSRKTVFIFLIAIIWLTGCITTAQKRPSFTQIESSIPPLMSDQGRIFFFASNYTSAICKVPKIKVNGLKVGWVPPSTFFFIDRPAGNYKVTAYFGPLLGTDKRFLTLNSGEIKYVEVIVIWSYPVDVKMIIHDADHGKEFLSKAVYYGPVTKNGKEILLPKSP